MKSKILITLTLILSFGAAYAWFAGVDGKWTSMLKGPDGTEFPITYVFKTNGTTLTGTLTASIGTFPIVGGVMKGDSLWFTTDMKTMQIKNKGKYFATGDSISLRVGTRLTHTSLKRVMEK